MSTPAAASIALAWKDDPRWSGIERLYGADDVVRLAGRCRSATRSPSSARSGSGTSSTRRTTSPPSAR